MKSYRRHYATKIKINALKMKIVSLETRASSAEQENDSLKLALKLIMQEMSVGASTTEESELRGNCPSRKFKE